MLHQALSYSHGSLVEIEMNTSAAAVVVGPSRGFDVENAPEAVVNDGARRVARFSTVGGAPAFGGKRSPGESVHIPRRGAGRWTRAGDSRTPRLDPQSDSRPRWHQLFSRPSEGRGALALRAARRAHGRVAC